MIFKVKGPKHLFINFGPETFARTTKAVKLLNVCNSFRLLERCWNVSIKATVVMPPQKVIIINEKIKMSIIV